MNLAFDPEAVPRGATSVVVRAVRLIPSDAPTGLTPRGWRRACVRRGFLLAEFTYRRVVRRARAEAGASC